MLSLPGMHLSDDISGTDPLRDSLALRTCRPLEDSCLTESQRTAAQDTSDLVNAVSKAIINRLEDHPINVKRKLDGKQPANCLLMRGAASLQAVPTMWHPI